MSAAPEAPLTEQRRRAVRSQGLSVGIATGMYGVSFGALSVASGLSILQTQALSALLFSGGSQFAVVGILGAGGSAVSAIATSTLLGIRNGLYGLQVARFIALPGPRRLLAAHLTIDESTAVGIAQEEPPAQRLGFWVTGIAVFIGWNLMTLVGAIVGNALGKPQTWGLDAAAAAAFCALLWPRLRTGDGRATAVLAAFIALVTLPLVPAGIPVILAAFAAVVVGWVGPGRHELPSVEDGFPGSDPVP
ncbi:MAG: AzlC family ABC transporter permease [Dermatophilaceae bacterium]